MAGLPSFVCPRCHGPVEATGDAYQCAACPQRYPVVAGIPDFRISPDPWLGIEEDRAKALRVEAATAGLDFDASVRAYWAMTPSTPTALAAVYVAHVLAASDRSAAWLATLPEGPPGPWLELGCGTGDLLAAIAECGQAVVGIDIALRWLVIARKRPGVLATTPLVCCAAQHLPFPDASVGRIAALGLLEHCPSAASVARESLRVLVTGGTLHLRTVNRFSLLPEPHVRVWGVGFVPRRLADGFVRRVSGLRYLHHRPVSVRELRRALRGSGFRHARVEAAALLPAERRRLGPVGRRLAPVYAALRRVPLARNLLAWVAPLLEARGVAA